MTAPTVGVRRSMLARVTPVLWRAAVVLATSATVLVTVLPDPGRPVLTSGGLAVGAALVAAVTGWALAGTLAVALATVTVLLAAALDASALRPAQVVAAAVLLLALVGALDRSEPGSGTAAVAVLRPPLGRRLGLPAAAVGAASLVALTAAQDVVPSVGLVLTGLAAVVAALVVATRAHRG